MDRFLFDRDISTLTDLELDITFFVEQVSKTKKPLIITQHGKNKAVLLDIEAYTALIEELELLKDIRVAEKELTKGEYLSNEEAKERLLK